MSRPYIATNSATAHTSDIFALATGEAYTITSGGDGQILLWNNNDAEPTPAPLKTDAAGVHHLSIDRTGNTLVSVTFTGVVTVYDLKTLESRVLDIDNVWAVAISPDATRLVASTMDPKVVVYDLVENKVVSVFATDKPLAISVDFSSGSFVAAGFSDGGIQIFNVDKDRLMFSLRGHSSAIRAVKISPADSLLAVASDSGLLSLYSVQSGEHVANLSTGTNVADSASSTGPDAVYSLDWNESGEFLLSTSFSGRARVWWMESRACVSTQADTSQPLFAGRWIRKGWGKGVIGGVNEGFVAAGVDRTVRWYREAAGN